MVAYLDSLDVRQIIHKPARLPRRGQGQDGYGGQITTDRMIRLWSDGRIEKNLRHLLW